jgi:hypothetical protein
VNDSINSENQEGNGSALGDERIKLELKSHAIRIFNNDALWAMLEKNAEAATEQLILDIKKKYFELFNTDFKVSDASIAVEIWGHVYAEKFAEAIKNFSSINFVDKIAEKILHHAEIIDIGETGYDDNRFVWDSLAVFKSVIAGLLFKDRYTD